MIENALELILVQLQQEFKYLTISYSDSPPNYNPNVIEELFLSHFKIQYQCSICLNINEEKYSSNYIKIAQVRKGASFNTLLEESLHYKSRENIICQNCKVYQNTEMKTELENLPTVMLLNCSSIRSDFWESVSDADETFKIKKNYQSWLPSE